MKLVIPHTSGEVVIALWQDGVPFATHLVHTNPATLLEVEVPDHAIRKADEMIDRLYATNEAKP